MRTIVNLVVDIKLYMHRYLYRYSIEAKRVRRHDKSEVYNYHINTW